MYCSHYGPYTNSYIFTGYHEYRNIGTFHLLTYAASVRDCREEYSKWIEEDLFSQVQKYSAHVKDLAQGIVALGTYVCVYVSTVYICMYVIS